MLIRNIYYFYLAFEKKILRTYFSPSLLPSPSYAIIRFCMNPPPPPPPHHPWCVRTMRTAPLETDNSVSVHQQNIQVLATVLYKIVNGLSPEIMKEVFPFNENTSYNTRNKRKFHSRSIKSVAFGSETLSHLASKIWELVPVEIKNVESVASFKRAIKKQKPVNCPCRLCRTYVSQIGFV